MLKLDFMPEATRKNFERLKDDPRLNGFTLIGGTALALQIGHRISEDLDFNVFGRALPKRSLDQLLSDLEEEGAIIESLISPEKKTAHKINTGYDLDDSIQDYLINGAKVTFHARHEQDRPKKQIEYLKSAAKIKIANNGFEILAVEGLFAMKSIVTYDRVRSRDIFDLMILIRDNGFNLKNALDAIAENQPARHKDPEHFKSVVTGIIPLDKADEGFSSISLDVKMQDIYKYFKSLIKEYEIQAVHALLENYRITTPK
jgi:hypothetical protein